MRWRDAAIWFCVLLAVLVPFSFAALSPLLAWRDAIYIIAGFAGVLGLALLLFQPLLALGLLPGIATTTARGLHKRMGLALVATVVVHVGGLWITSPPDVVDALLFVSPTPFSAWGVVAMWAVFATALIAAFKRHWRISPRTWNRFHALSAMTICRRNCDPCPVDRRHYGVFLKAGLVRFGQSCDALRPEPSTSADLTRRADGAHIPRSSSPA